MPIASQQGDKLRDGCIGGSALLCGRIEFFFEAIENIESDGTAFDNSETGRLDETARPLVIEFE